MIKTPCNAPASLGTAAGASQVRLNTFSARVPSFILTFIAVDRTDIDKKHHARTCVVRNSCWRFDRYVKHILLAHVVYPDLIAVDRNRHDKKHHARTCVARTVAGADCNVSLFCSRMLFIPISLQSIAIDTIRNTMHAPASLGMAAGA
jgi:hypothetical protein